MKDYLNESPIDPEAERLENLDEAATIGVAPIHEGQRRIPVAALGHDRHHRQDNDGYEMCSNTQDEERLLYQALVEELKVDHDILLSYYPTILLR